jgi:hypothetical protein
MVTLQLTRCLAEKHAARLRAAIVLLEQMQRQTLLTPEIVVLHVQQTLRAMAELLEEGVEGD